MSRMPKVRPAMLVTLLSAALPIAAIAVLFGASERRLREYPDVPPFTRTISTDLETRTRGELIARTRGCQSCHGDNLEGKDWSQEWTGIGRVVAVNLARYAKENDAATIERALRHGIGRDGRALYSMPSYNFKHLTDDDVAALIAYLQSHPVLGDTLTKASLSLEVRWDLAFGDAMHVPELVAAVPPLITTVERDGEAMVRGEYLAMTTCNECHGFDVRGGGDGPGSTPDLAIVGGYTREQFGRLLSTGESKDGRRDMRLMSGTARERFVHFTEAQVDDLYAFLRSLPARPIPTGVPWRGGG
jgi:mono/diheme cytochrome c family protein